MGNLLTITNILTIPASIIGIISYFVFPASFPLIVLVCACICILHSILNVLFGGQNNLATEIITILIGVAVAYFFHFNMRNSICVAICVAELLFSVIPFLFLFLSLGKK